VNDGYDLLVLGGGIAGAAAALAAARRGRRVAVVRGGPGATALSAGAWRGPLPVEVGEALAEGGVPHERPAGALPHPRGELVPADHAAPAQCRAVPVEGALVCGIVGLPGFDAAALARLWGEAAGVRLEAAVVAAGSGTPAAGWSPVALAAALDRDPSPLADALAEAVRVSGATRVIVPAVAGLERSAAVLAALGEAAGVPVGEALGVPPSLPGWRLDRALLAGLATAGVEVVQGRVVEREVEGRRVVAVGVRPTRGDAEALRLEAAAYVLATGKYLGGGIVVEGTIREAALGCPVRVDHVGPPVEAFDALALTHADRSLPQPLLRAGVETDAQGRPVDGRGDVVYENVYVAGTVRAGRSGSEPGLGAAAKEGVRAGEAAG